MAQNLKTYTVLRLDRDHKVQAVGYRFDGERFITFYRYDALGDNVDVLTVRADDLVTIELKEDADA